MKKTIEKLRLREIHDGSFSAEKVHDYPNHYIALDSEKRLVLLLRSVPETQKTILNSRGKYLNIFYDEVCEVRTLTGIVEEKFTILNLMSSDLFLEELFLKIAQDLLEIIGNNPKLGNNSKIYTISKRHFLESSAKAIEGRIRPMG